MYIPYFYDCLSSLWFCQRIHVFNAELFFYMCGDTWLLIVRHWSRNNGVKYPTVLIDSNCPYVIKAAECVGLPCSSGSFCEWDSFVLMGICVTVHFHCSLIILEPMTDKLGTIGDIVMLLTFFLKRQLWEAYIKL